MARRPMLWEQEDWAIAETLARTEGSPYAAPPYDRRRRDRPDNDPDRLIDAALRRLRESRERGLPARDADGRPARLE